MRLHLHDGGRRRLEGPALLTPCKCPGSVDFDEALPRQDTGKLCKRLIRERYWGEASRGSSETPRPVGSARLGVLC